MHKHPNLFILNFLLFEKIPLIIKPRNIGQKISCSYSFTNCKWLSLNLKKLCETGPYLSHVFWNTLLISGFVSRLRQRYMEEEQKVWCLSPFYRWLSLYHQQMHRRYVRGGAVRWGIVLSVGLGRFEVFINRCLFDGELLFFVGQQLQQILCWHHPWVSIWTLGLLRAY